MLLLDIATVINALSISPQPAGIHHRGVVGSRKLCLYYALALTDAGTKSSSPLPYGQNPENQLPGSRMPTTISSISERSAHLLSRMIWTFS